VLRIPEIQIASMKNVLVMPKNTGKKYIRSCNKRSEFLSHFMFFFKKQIFYFCEIWNSDPGFRVARVNIKGINIIGFELALKTGSERTTSPPAIFLNIDPPSNVGRITLTDCCSIETYLSAIKSWMTLIVNFRNLHKKQKFTLKSGKLWKTSISSEWRHNHVVCYSKN